MSVAKRRRAQAKLSFGKAAVRAHKKKTGRTGRVFAKRKPGKTPRSTKTYPNPPWQSRRNLLL